MANKKRLPDGPLTYKQQQILDFIKKETREKGYPPTIREICATVGLKSTSSVFAHLNTLQEKGYIYRDPSKPRALELQGRKDQNAPAMTTSIPEAISPFLLKLFLQEILLSSVCAGTP